MEDGVGVQRPGILQAALVVGLPEGQGVVDDGLLFADVFLFVFPGQAPVDERIGLCFSSFFEAVDFFLVLVHEGEVHLVADGAEAVDEGYAHFVDEGEWHYLESAGWFCALIVTKFSVVAILFVAHHAQPGAHAQVEVQASHLGIALG